MSPEDTPQEDQAGPPAAWSDAPQRAGTQQASVPSGPQGGRADPSGGNGGTYDDGRRETPAEKLDRNWLELLQELRVMQTGIQVLAGFLLTLPFQPRFGELDDFQLTVYLVLVLLSALTTACLLSAVNMHRVFFRQHIREALVTNGDRLLRSSILMIGLVLVGTTGLIFDLVLDRSAGAITAVAFGAVLVVLWGLMPRLIRRRIRRANGRSGT